MTRKLKKRIVEKAQGRLGEINAFFTNALQATMQFGRKSKIQFDAYHPGLRRMIRIRIEIKRSLVKTEQDRCGVERV